ncbi:MAG: magnesium transporter [Myxococcota bacterium]
MTTELNQRTEALLRRLVRRDAGPAVRKLIRNFPAADVAAAMEHLTFAEQRRLYRHIQDPTYAAEVLAYLSDGSTREVTKDLSEEAVVELLTNMEPDDATDTVSALDDDLRLRVLSELPADEAGDEVRRLLAFPPDTAGGIMSPNVFTVHKNTTVAEAIAAVQAQHENLETVQYVYVVDSTNHLLGVTSLRSLLTHPSRTPIKTFMVTDPITVGPAQDQEEVARIVARYDFLAVPVVDKSRRILGLVTVDDVVDVIRQEAEEDMMLMAGMQPRTHQSVLQQSGTRAVWLLATIAGGVLAAEIIGLYEASLTKMAVLAGFIPVVMGMGGNVGIQSATLAVRGLATGEVQLSGVGSFLWQEVRVGVLLGAFYAVLLGVYGVARFPSTPMVGASLSISILLAILSAGGIGALLPVGLQRLGADPAVATGPFVTTLVDLLGIVIYFNVARALLQL